MKLRASLVVALAFVSLFAGVGGAAAQSVDILIGAPAVGSQASIPPPLRLAERAGVTPLARLAPALEAAPVELNGIAVWNRAKKLPARDGFARPLSQTFEVRFGQEVLTRAEGPYAGGLLGRAGGALVWGAEIRVDSAWRVRLHLADVKLPSGTQLWVYNDEETAGPFGMELRTAKGDLWTPSVGGGVVRLEVRLPGGIPGTVNGLGFTVAEVAESFLLDGEGAPLTGVSVAPRLGECLIDAQCNSEIDLDPIIRDAVQQAVGRYSFVDDVFGPGFLCSGGLLNDTDAATVIPWFLTANHCLDSQSEAASVEVFWDYYTSTCNGAAPSLASRPRTNGANLVSTNFDNDHTLLNLNSIPSNRALLGWNANTSAVPNGTTLYRISHPFGGTQQYSRNHVDTGFSACFGADRPDFLYELFTPGLGDKGGTFGGSSGAPLFLPAGQAVGQLTGGCPPDNTVDPNDGCDYRNSEVDGAFSSSFDDVGPFLTGMTGCLPDATTLCLNNNRFSVQLDWRSRAADPFVPANVVPGVSSDDSGLFYFLNPNNWELLIKVLDGCSFNNQYWVFFAATTDVEFTLTVTDTQASEVKVYTNPLRSPADAVTDTAAFATCP